MTVLGLHIARHDTGAALISDDRVIAIAEERLCRIKYSPDIFPVRSILYCLKTLDVKPEEVDLIVIDQIGLPDEFNMKVIFERWDKQDKFKNAELRVINHQDAHAASAFFCSPFKEAAILIYDGYGEHFVNHFGITSIETETLYFGKDDTFHLIDKTTHTRVGGTRPYTTGVGHLYSMLSRRYLNFGLYNEGKMMGLAPYAGEKNDLIFKLHPQHHWMREYNGRLVCNPNILYPMNRGKSPKRVSIIVKNVLKYVSNIFFNLAYRKNEKFLRNPNIFPTIYLPRKPREDEALPDEYYTAVASTGQQILNQFAFLLGKKLRNITRSENLCVSGGVGLNIDVNRDFLDKVGFKHIFIQPAASDTGIPLGCALYGWHAILKNPRRWVMRTASLGRVYSEPEIQSILPEYENKIKIVKSPNVCKETAELVANGKIIGWFHGGSEYGPRALGNRSILCDARDPQMKDILNKKVKHREPWRPFAASVLQECVSEWFELNTPSPFMLLAAPVREQKRQQVPSIVHVDGSCRIQSVTRIVNARYYTLIKEFYKLTNVPLVLNTSFNLAGEPIIETPKDAIECFLSTQMDCLIIEDYIIYKR